MPNLQTVFATGGAFPNAISASRNVAMSYSTGCLLPVLLRAQLLSPTGLNRQVYRRLTSVPGARPALGPPYASH